MKKCSKCGAPMIFIKSLSGKWQTCDPEGKRLSDAKDGEKLILADGRIYCAALAPPKSHLKHLIGYTSHWATCPEAERFRQERREASEKEPLPNKEEPE